MLNLGVPVQLLAQNATQDANTISYQQTVLGKITNDTFRVIYTFQGRQGDVVDATLNQTDGTLDPVLLLTDDQNNLMASNDDGSDPGFNAAIVSEALPRDGNYFLIVTRFGQERGLSTGAYSLTLTLAGVSGGDSSNPSSPLQYGDNVVGDLDAQQYQQVYAFRATRGDVIQATMQRISGNLDSLLILADAQGKILISNDEDPDSPGTLDAAFYNLRIEKTGIYELIATRFGQDAGTSRGGFSLTLSRLAPEMLGKVPETAILLDYGTTLKGDIDPTSVLHFYVIEAKKGDVLTIDAERTRGNLDPILTLYTPDTNNLKELASNDSGVRGQNARISAYTVPADGNYILLVSRFNRDKGITSGSYAVTAVGHSGATVGAGGKLTLRYGSAVSAIISDSNAVQQYTFAGSTGDVINITMDVTSGDLLPQLMLVDPLGKQIGQDDPGTDGAKLSQVRLTATGNYVIVATRRGKGAGTTDGSYILTLDTLK
jgi:Bacterial pre-peptidase C-terminal domain